MRESGWKLGGVKSPMTESELVTGSSSIIIESIAVAA